MLLNRDVLLDKKFNVQKKGGYNHLEVDSFLDDIANELAEMQKLVDADKVELARYKDMEHALTNTMVAAQKTARQVIDEAQAQATTLKSNAESDAMNIVMKAQQESYEKTRKANAEIEELSAKIEELKKSALEFYGNVESRVSSYMDALKNGGFLEYVNSVNTAEVIPSIQQTEDIVVEPTEKVTFDLNAFLAKPITGIDDAKEIVETFDSNTTDDAALNAVLESYAKEEANTPVVVEEDELHMSFGTDATNGSIDMTEIYSNAPVSDKELKALIDELVE